MFSDNSASYDNAALGTLQLRPTGELEQGLGRDHAAMSEMFMDVLTDIRRLSGGTCCP